MKNNKARTTGLITWVYTEDLEETARFYEETLGFECSRREETARIFDIACGACIGVCKVFANRVVEPRGGMISIVTDDVDAWYQKLKSTSMTLATPPERLEQFGIYTFFVTDPNGYVLEFQQFET